MKQILIISGPTATGKTALAVKLAKEFNGELISADSRQIYRGLSIGVGKDHPVGTPIHMLDLITPDKSYSVADYRQNALSIINTLHQQGKLPILVGCSGFYIDSICNSKYDTFSIKPNIFLRSIISRLPVSISQNLLKLIDKDTYSKLNNSDINNPLRLIRKIEIALTPFRQRGIKGDLDFDFFHLSLTAPNKFLYSRIDQRVDDRLKIGHLNELQNLLKSYHWTSPGLKVSAYSSFKEYYAQKNTLEKSIQEWKYLEHRDARRQKTWFKKIKPIIFVDISKPQFVRKIIGKVRKWYNKP